MLRKHIIPTQPPAAGKTGKPDSKDIPSLATVQVTSESADHPVDHLFDAQDGPGGTRWVAAGDGEQTLILAFDAPQTIREVSLETEEPHVSRTQEISLSLSRDGGGSYREVLRQEFTFSPSGTTFEREEWAVPADGVTHLRVVIKPDKGGAPCRATLTSLTIR
ncbi:MAG TPA: hypothetical protein VGT40_16115 [Methylomirabilota bacterium]|jgi:hypothetical protein|nr:hypothetical protein [Methylomirabilota bacterium]